MPASLCDAPGCANDLVALIRGVGLCEAHFQVLNAVATQQGVSPSSLSRPVVVALLRAPIAAAVPDPAAPSPPPARFVAPGFYWLADGPGWTVVHVEGDTFQRLGHAGELPVAQLGSARLVPVQLPAAFNRDALLRAQFGRKHAGPSLSSKQDS